MADDPTTHLDDARRLIDQGDPEAAIRIVGRLTNDPDRDVAGEAWLLLGRARYLLDDEPGALAAWTAAAQTDGAGSWLGWRSVAEQQVRDGDLEAAIASYREADRRAPPAERGAIANRIAWLLKETGHDFAARRQFNRARGAYAQLTPIVTYAIIAVCVGLFLLDGAMSSGSAFSGGIGPLGEQHLINGVRVAQGEWWRIFTSAFFHLGLIHLGFNMYVLYLYGPIAEGMYGPIEYALIYLLSAAGGSVLTILVTPAAFAAGASGAIFGVIGLLFAVSRRHHAALGPHGRRMMAGIGGYLVFLLIFTFVVPGISWTGHLGGLAVGAVLGFVLPPTGVQTMAGLWRTASGEQLHGGMPLAVRAAIYLVVAAALAAGTWVAVQGVIG